MINTEPIKEPIKIAGRINARKSQLDTAHRNEWVVDSCVSPEIAEANVRTVRNKPEIAKLLNWKSCSLSGGWWVSGVDPETGERRESGQFKPDRPRTRNGKPLKYETPKKDDKSPQPTEAIFLEVPSDPDYWERLLTPDHSTDLLIITEGAKKAGAAITAGIPCIAIAGVWNGQWEKCDRLIPDLEKFATFGRSICLAFDADVMRKDGVQKALSNLARLSKKSGCELTVAELPDTPETKGIDDFIKARGQEAFRELIKNATSYNKWAAQVSEARKQQAEQGVDTAEVDSGIVQLPSEWKAPVTWNGEIGWLTVKEDKRGKLVTTFEPECNFDFVVESELMSDAGGGLILQVKRSIDSRQKRVIISSQDYGCVKDFEAALKKALGTGVVCNLKNEDLKSLIHVRLKEYRERGGKTYRLQGRFGQQVDSHWVFSTCQITKDGDWSNQPSSDWVFNPDLGTEEQLRPPIATPPAQGALKRLVNVMRRFYGRENIFPAMMALGFSAAAVHYQTIMRLERRFPLMNLVGDPGTVKSVIAGNALSLVGWRGNDGFIGRVSISKLYETLKLAGSLPMCLDDPLKSADLEEVLKQLYNGLPRSVRGNVQTPHGPLMTTTNWVIGDHQLATLTRILQIHIHRSLDGDASAWDDLQEAMEHASGCLPDLIKLGYPRAEIKELEQELRSYLPKSHPRIASSMALILWYAMAVAKLADFDPVLIKQYVIEQLCPAANAADSNVDSLTDFLDKLYSLKSESLVGKWNCVQVQTKTGKALAVQINQVFPLIERKFNPIYSRKVVEALITKAGGTLGSVQKFHSDRDSSLAYSRAVLTAVTSPIEPEYKPKRCVLIPGRLVRQFMDCDDEPPTPPSDGGGNGSPHNNSPCDNRGGGEALVTSPVTPVTSSYTQLHQKCNQQDVEPVSFSASSVSSVTSFLDKSINQNQSQSPSNPQEWDDALHQKNGGLLPTKDVTEENFEAETLTTTESERLHQPCNQDVTGCNQQEKDVTGQQESEESTTPPTTAEPITPVESPAAAEELSPSAVTGEVESPVVVEAEVQQPELELPLAQEQEVVAIVDDGKLYRVWSEYYGRTFEGCTLVKSVVKTTQGAIKSWSFRTLEGEILHVYNEEHFKEEASPWEADYTPAPTESVTPVESPAAPEELLPPAGTGETGSTAPAEPPAPISEGDTVRFADPFKLPSNKKFEGVPLKVIRIGALVTCELPDGSSANLALRTLSPW